jgi:hypothetical protein
MTHLQTDVKVRTSQELGLIRWEDASQLWAGTKTPVGLGESRWNGGDEGGRGEDRDGGPQFMIGGTWIT